MICKTCQGAMKPLFSGWYCPNDCDRPQPPAPAVAKLPEKPACEPDKHKWGWDKTYGFVCAHCAKTTNTVFIGPGGITDMDVGLNFKAQHALFVDDAHFHRCVKAFSQKTRDEYSGADAVWKNEYLGEWVKPEASVYNLQDLVTKVAASRVDPDKFWSGVKARPTLYYNGYTGQPVKLTWNWSR